MKNYSVFIALLLSACGGFDSKQEFLQDSQNAKKLAELSNKRIISSDCDKLIKLYDFAVLKSPTIEDLSKIMPIFGLKADDAKNIDKVYKIDFDKIDKYNCYDNTDSLLHEIEQYCNNKYPTELFKRDECEDYLSYIVLNNNYVYNRKQDIEGNRSNIIYSVKLNIQSIYIMPEKADKFLPEFTATELIKADNEVLGTYDSDCYGNLCEHATQNVTRLNAALVLYDYCVYNKTFLPNDGYDICVCFAHETYQKVNYKNVIYIHEKKELPQSKKTEFNQIYKKCEQKIEKQRIKAEKERYGEAKSANSDENNVFIEALENTAWAHRTITETRKKAENK
ncbi:MAG: hypothetical protein IKP35_04125 [Alphaproteobacteria bacterium]|nr:hypothetical protein [Alphaproteobacteria bacterium]